MSILLTKFESCIQIESCRSSISTMQVHIPSVHASDNWSRKYETLVLWSNTALQAEERFGGYTPQRVHQRFLLLPESVIQEMVASSTMTWPPVSKSTESFQLVTKHLKFCHYTGLPFVWQSQARVKFLFMDSQSPLQQREIEELLPLYVIAGHTNWPHPLVSLGHGLVSKKIISGTVQWQINDKIHRL